MILLGVGALRAGALINGKIQIEMDFPLKYCGIGPKLLKHVYLLISQISSSFNRRVNALPTIQNWSNPDGMLAAGSLVLLMASLDDKRRTSGRSEESESANCCQLAIESNQHRQQCTTNKRTISVSLIVKHY